MTATATDTVEVRLVGFPLNVYARARDHHEELMREFALLALRPPGPDDPAVPHRLLDLVDELTTRYAGFAENAEVRRDEALERGEASIDLDYRVPRGVREPAINLGRLLDEADEFCRRGALLTLATPPDAVLFRRWYLTEFVNQIDGNPPVPWPVYAAGQAGSD